MSPPEVERVPHGPEPVAADGLAAPPVMTGGPARRIQIAGGSLIVLGLGAAVFAARSAAELTDMLMARSASGAPLDRLVEPSDVTDAELLIGAPILLGFLSFAIGAGLLRRRAWGVLAGVLLAVGGLGVGVVTLTRALEGAAAGGFGVYAVLLFLPVAAVTISVAGGLLWALVSGRSAVGPLSKSDGRPLAVLAFVVALSALATVGIRAWQAAQLAAAEERRAGVEALPSTVHVTARIGEATVGSGATRTFRVRVVESLAIEIRILAEQEIALAEPPYACLLSRYSSPEFAERYGLVDRCWGEPDLSALLADALPLDADGHPAFPAAREVAIEATLRREPGQCDYPPGPWHLEIVAYPLSDVGHGVELADVEVDVPLEGSARAPSVGALDPVRLCGHAPENVRLEGESEQQ